MTNAWLSNYGKLILLALQSKPIYLGTARPTESEYLARKKRNKRARRSRVRNG